MKMLFFGTLALACGLIGAMCVAMSFYYTFMSIVSFWTLHWADAWTFMWRDFGAATGGFMLLMAAGSCLEMAGSRRGA